ncbi:hypothetical protein ACOSQ2_020012 [Xanthoceras sorbifolium]
MIVFGAFPWFGDGGVSGLVAGCPPYAKPTKVVSSPTGRVPDISSKEKPIAMVQEINPESLEKLLQVAVVEGWDRTDKVGYVAVSGVYDRLVRQLSEGDFLGGGQCLATVTTHMHDPENIPKHGKSPLCEPVLGSASNISQKVWVAWGIGLVLICTAADR